MRAVTRKSSCVNARGISPVMYQVLLCCSFPDPDPGWGRGFPHPGPGWGGGGLCHPVLPGGYPHPVLVAGEYSHSPDWGYPHPYLVGGTPSPHPYLAGVLPPWLAKWGYLLSARLEYPHPIGQMGVTHPLPPTPPPPSQLDRGIPPLVNKTSLGCGR